MSRNKVSQSPDHGKDSSDHSGKTNDNLQNNQPNNEKNGPVKSNGSHTSRHKAEEVINADVIRTNALKDNGAGGNSETRKASAGWIHDEGISKSISIYN